MNIHERRTGAIKRNIQRTKELSTVAEIPKSIDGYFAAVWEQSQGFFSLKPIRDLKLQQQKWAKIWKMTSPSQEKDPLLLLSWTATAAGEEESCQTLVWAENRGTLDKFFKRWVWYDLTVWIPRNLRHRVCIHPPTLCYGPSPTKFADRAAGLRETTLQTFQC